LRSDTRRRAACERSDEKRRLWGQYLTPPDVARFVLAAARIALGRDPERLVDPACGDGVFLEAALEAGLVDARGVFGIEIDPCHARAARRLGLGANLVCADGLTDPLPPALQDARGEGFDLVVGNPPFGGGGGRGRLEMLFVARFVALARPGGAGAVILPSGVFANASAQKLRDSLLGEITPAAVVELPPGTFRRAGAAAATCVLVFRKRRARASDRCLVVAHPTDRGDAGGHFGAALGVLATGLAARNARRIPVRDLEGRRWDPGHWLRAAADIFSLARVPLEPLGGFMEHITYGPILTGEAAKRDLGGRVKVVGLKELRPTGLDLRRAKRVRARGVHDPARCRLRAGDVVLARSGAGSLLKGRAAVFDGSGPATVGCFVDLVRLSGLEPGYAVLCLRSRLFRAQVASIANGVGTPNLSFGEIRGLLVPRLGEATESRLAREEAAVRKLHARALRAGREPAEAAKRLDAALAALEGAALSGARRRGPDGQDLQRPGRRGRGRGRSLEKGCA
jgi:predicted RNA methylase